VEAAINAAARIYRPTCLASTYRKVNPADAPIMILGLTSDKYDKPPSTTSFICNRAKAIAAARRWQVSVGAALAFGARGSEPHAAQQLWLTLSNVQSVLSQQNVHQATGQL